MQTTSKIEFANTLRGFAALFVILAHYFCSPWSDQGQELIATLTNATPFSNISEITPSYINWLRNLPFLSFAAFGVALFFIISGFVIPFSLQKINSLEFCMNRIFRIFPTYIIGFSIVLFFIFLSSTYFSKAWPFTPREIIIHYIPGIRDILWSRHIDGIVWTLEIEVKFYILCAFFISWFRASSSKVFLLPVGLFLISLYLNTKIPVWETTHMTAYKLAVTFFTSSQYIIFMFIGTVFNYLYTKKIDLSIGYLIIASLFTLFCFIWWRGFYADSFIASWNYGFALLTFMFAYCFPHLFKSNSVFNFFANISYPLYVIHAIPGYVVLRILVGLGYSVTFSLSSTVVLFMFLSWILHKFIERPSQKYGKIISSIINDKILILINRLRPRTTLVKENSL